MDIILNETINEALSKNYRQYLCGTLERPQLLNEIKDKSIEVGISVYDEFTADAPHAHSISTEYVYVLEGETKLIYLATGEEAVLNKGGFARVLPNIYYASKHKNGTKILFIKSTCGNDKLLAKDISPKVSSWLEIW